MYCVVDFGSVENCEYFLSIDADHMWYMHHLFDVKRQNETSLRLNHKFIKHLGVHEKNEKLLFSTPIPQNPKDKENGKPYDPNDMKNRKLFEPYPKLIVLPILPLQVNNPEINQLF